jgi:DNA-binding GntR family transcriptional regulator
MPKKPHKSKAFDTRPLTGAQRVYDALRQSIIVLDVEPGVSLEEERLCKQYSVSRTPMREALIRLASEGLVELEPNRGARVAALQFGDVLDHYEAMDVFQPVIWHFAAVRRTDTDVSKIKACLENVRSAISRQHAGDIVQSNYEIHCAIAAASHNRSLEKAYQHMLVDKLRVAQHAARGLKKDRGQVLAMRLEGALRILDQFVGALTKQDPKRAESLARDYNAHVRQQIVGILSSSVGKDIKFNLVK